MLSHELRNPIAPIMNAVSLLGAEGGAETPTQRQARAIIERQIGQLKVLVDDLLEISRITSGRIKLHRESVDLRDVVDGALETAGSLISQRKHEVVVSRPAEPVWVHGDSTRLEQVVVNLLSNAAKYSEEGGHIAISLEEKGEEAVLRVRDTGIGIAPELLPHIFDLFTQAERSLDRSQGGLGVGLTVTQKLVEMHNGRLEVQSEIGRGSEFVVRVPVSRPGPDAQALCTESGDRHIGSLRVLVVDDNTDQADTAALLLRNAGHDVRVEYAGPDALDAAVAFVPDVVLLDIGLPVMNGYDVARRLRQQHRLKGVRLIAISGYGQDLDRERSHAVGFDVHLVKPVTPRELRAAVVGDWPT
jgi:CheY-like chemotaxis protein